MNATNNKTITILYREQFADGLVCYTITSGSYNHEEHVRFHNGQPNGCTCKNKTKWNECQHQESLAKVERGYQEIV
ncbi:MAG: hypothetical protein ACJ788_00185 [Ktedonobacteraceae bacterium]